MWNKIFFILIIIFLQLPIYSDESQEDILEWSDVRSAKGYQVQIRNSAKKVVIDEKVNENKFKINLPEGNYEQRIGVYNKFSKVSAYSDWDKMVVKKVKAPALNSDSINLTDEVLQKKSIIIQGENFTPDTKVFLESQSEKISFNNIKILSDKEIELILPEDKKISGSYDILIVNPRNKKFKKEKYINIAKAERVVDIKPEQKEENKSDQISQDNLNIDKQGTKFSYGNIIRSSILPGWGQYNRGDRWRGITYGGMFLVGLAALNNQYGAYKSSLETYENNTNTGLLLGLSSPTTAGRLVLLNYYQNTQGLQTAEEQLNSVNQIALGVQAIYLVNLIDAIVFNNKNRDEGIETGFRIYTKQNYQVYSPGIVNRQTEIGFRYNF